MTVRVEVAIAVVVKTHLINRRNYVVKNLGIKCLKSLKKCRLPWSHGKRSGSFLEYTCISRHSPDWQNGFLSQTTATSKRCKVLGEQIEFLLVLKSVQQNHEIL